MSENAPGTPESVSERVGAYGFFMSSELMRVLPNLHLTATQRDVLDLILGEMQDGGVVPLSRTQIADRLSINVKTVSTTTKILTDIGLLWRTSRRAIQVNPTAAYKSATGDPEEWLRAVRRFQGKAPKINLPDYERRPPRRVDDKGRHLKAV
ncbi:replication/maintenance protein RepL [Nocardiopsis dassonvillei]|uniref:replication/maintenance protein RepL n=1 Tax=Nocardiopsis dassonvillei TaxID=2014 RepID=UPI00366BE2FF